MPNGNGGMSGAGTAGGGNAGTPAIGGASAAGTGGTNGTSTGGTSGSAAASGTVATGGAAGALNTAGAAGALTASCTPPEDVFSPIAKLSQTGCVDPQDPKKPSARAVSYEVNSPLWSDASDKTRAFVLPVGAKIHVRNCVADATACPQGPADDGHWEFPVGSVLIKTFAFDSKLVETRLFMRLDASNWVGYSYQWNEAQTDATIVSADGAQVSFNTGTRTVDWHYPSQKDCLNCHNAAGGSSLGPENVQMNRMVAGQNQIDAFAARGLFDVAPAKPYKAALVTPYPSQAGSPSAQASVTEKARSYLHANCAFCHRPGGNFANFDYRYDTALKDMNLCNTEVMKGAIANAPGKTKNLVPGQPESSVMWLRMNEPDPLKGRMPQIASFAVDHEAVTVVGDWIKTITACP